MSTADHISIDGYRDFTPLGTGGYSTVFRAYQERFDRPVAVKVLTVELDEKAQRRFERECQATGHLSGHPNIVTVLDSGVTHDGQAYMTTELMDKGSLGDWLASHDTMPVTDVLQIGVKMCGALTAVHHAGILHRDIKPQNILVSAYGEPALADFGISAVGMGVDATGRTSTFTPQHVSPEALEGEVPAPTMDVYSLGSTLYHLLAGRPPFESDDGKEGFLPFIRRVLNDPVPDLPSEEATPDSEAVLVVLRKAMAKDANDRFQGAEEFGTALQGLQEQFGQPVTSMVGAVSIDSDGSSSPIGSLLLAPSAMTTTDPRRGSATVTRNPMVIAVAAVAAAAFIVMAVLVSRSGRDAVVSAGVPPGQVGGTVKGAGVPPVLNAAPPTRGGKLVVGVAGERPGLNPLQQAANVTSLPIVSPIYETLVRETSTGPRPDLAEKVEPNADLTVWTIRLRPDIAFHDRSALDSATVKRNIEDRKKNVFVGPLLKPVERVEIVDALTSRVILNTPWAAFPSMLAAPQSLIVSNSMLDGAASDFVGTGPFVHAKSEGNTVSLKRNPAYRVPDRPFLDEIEFRFFAESRGAAEALDAGQLQLVITSDGGVLAGAQKAHAVKVDRRSIADFVVLNTAVAPFDDQRLREALAYATDQQKLIDKLEGGLGSIAVGGLLTEKNVPDDNGARSFDLAKARELVNAYEAEKGQVSVKLTTVLGSDLAKVAPELKTAWIDAGVDVQVDAIEGSRLITEIALGRTQAALYSTAVIADPDSLFAFFHSSTVAPIGGISFNLAHFSSPVIDELFETGRRAGDPAVRKTAYEKLTRELNRTVPFLVLLLEPLGVISAEAVTGLTALDMTILSSGYSAGWATDIGVAR